MKKTIAVAIPTIDRMFTESKILAIGDWLALAGYDPLFLLYDDEGERVAKEQNRAYLRPAFTRLSIDSTKEAQACQPLLTAPLFPDSKTPSPTWGDLILFDDYLGGAQGWNIAGADTLRPDALIVPIPRSEACTEEDAQMALALWRFRVANHIPTIGLEVGPLSADLQLAQYPVDFLLTKSSPETLDTGHIAPLVFRLPVGHRYVLRPGRDSLMDAFLANEKNLRENLGPSNARYLHLPFHLGFKSDIICQLERIKPYVPALLEADFHLLVSGTSGNVRRGLTEIDIINQGVSRWFAAWPEDRRRIMVDPPIYFCAMLAEAVLTPYSSSLTEMLSLYGHDMVRLGEEEKLDNLTCSVTIVQALDHLLKEAA